MTQTPRNDRKADTIFHWLPSSVLGGLEVAALTLIQTTPFFKHVVVAGDATGPAVAQWREAGAEVEQLDGWHGTLGLPWARRWRQFVRERGVRHLIAWSPTRLPQLLAPLDAGCRCVVHLGTAGRSSLRVRLQDRVMRSIFRTTYRPKLLACSQVVAESARHDPVYEGYTSSVIPNSARSCFFDLGANASRPVSSPTTWGMLARLDSFKDHSNLIEAIRLLPPTLDIRLEFAGGGELRDTLQKKVFDYGLEKRIYFLGSVGRPQDAMRSWQAFIFSTTEREGFGIAVAEAMAAGLPCVLTDVPVMREVAGDSAYYAEPGSPDSLRRRILEIYADPAEAARRAAQGRRRAQSLYAPEVFARQYLSALGLTYPA